MISCYGLLYRASSLHILTRLVARGAHTGICEALDGRLRIRRLGYVGSGAVRRTSNGPLKVIFTARNLVMCTRTDLWAVWDLAIIISKLSREARHPNDGGW